MVSVIIPIYNVQDYLARCIDSVLAQTYTDLEIILVDDGSLDASGDICDEYDLKHRFIRVIHKTNGGLSDARNAGLEVAQGSYVTFIDADDYVHPRFVETLMHAIDNTGAQIAACTWQELQDGATPRKVNLDKVPSKTYSQQEAINTVFYQGELNHSACSRIFEMQLFDDIRFPEGALYEDLAIIYQLLRKVEKVTLLNAPMYYYMHRAGSIITTMSLRRTQVLDHLERLEKQVAKEAPQYLPAVRSRHLSACFNMLRLMPAHDPRWQPTKARCWKYIKNMRFLCIKDRKVRIKNKIAILLSYFGVGFLMTFINKSKLMG